MAYAILDSSGNILNAQTNIARLDDIDDPTVAASTKDASNNNVVIAWEEYDGNDDQVWFTVLNSAGGTEVNATKVTSTSQDSQEINAAVLPNGNFAIVWEDDDDVNYEQVWFTIRGADGSIVKGNTKLTTNDEDSGDPSVAATPGGDIVIIWEGYVGGDEYVFYAILNGSGNVVKAIAEVTTSSLDDDDCDVAIDRNGNIVISWEDWRGETDRVSFAILAPGGAIVTTDQALTDGTYDINLDGGEGKRQVATKPTPASVRPVGGEAFSPDRMAVAAPWVMLAIAVTTGTGMLIRRRRTAS